MISLLWNLLLALVWGALNSDFSISTLFVGFLLGTAILVLVRRQIGAPGYVTQIRDVLLLVFFVAWELLLANMRVAWDVITPWQTSTPGILAVPLEPMSDGEIATLAGLITLTPGSTSIDVSEDRKTLYVHTMYLDPNDIEKDRRNLRVTFMERFLKAVR